MLSLLISYKQAEYTIYTVIIFPLIQIQYITILLSSTDNNMGLWC